MAKLIEATYGDALFELAVEESRVDSLYDEAGAVIVWQTAQSSRS